MLFTQVNFDIFIRLYSYKYMSHLLFIWDETYKIINFFSKKKISIPLNFNPQRQKEEEYIDDEKED